MQATPIVPNRSTWPNDDTGAGRSTGGARLGGDLVDRHRSRRETLQHSGDALEVGGGGGDDVDPAVGVVDPVHGHFVNAQPAAFGQHQKLGVEEPSGVVDMWE